MGLVKTEVGPVGGPTGWGLDTRWDPDGRTGPLGLPREDRGSRQGRGEGV